MKRCLTTFFRSRRRRCNGALYAQATEFPHLMRINLIIIGYFVQTMSATDRYLQPTFSKHGLAIAAALSIALLIAAGKSQTPRWWLVLPGWLIFVVCIAIRFASIPNESPYRQAFYLMGLPLLFYFGLWETAFRSPLR